MYLFVRNNREVEGTLAIEPRKLFSGIWGNQCIIFRDQGSTDPLLGASLLTVSCKLISEFTKPAEDPYK